jgi:hypothetical protein
MSRLDGKLAIVTGSASDAVRVESLALFQVCLNWKALVAEDVTLSFDSIDERRLAENNKNR